MCILPSSFIFWKKMWKKLQGKNVGWKSCMLIVKHSYDLCVKAYKVFQDPETKVYMQNEHNIYQFVDNSWD